MYCSTELALTRYLRAMCCTTPRSARVRRTDGLSREVSASVPVAAILRKPLRVVGRISRLLRCARTAFREEERRSSAPTAMRPADARLAGFCAAFVALRVPWAVR